MVVHCIVDFSELAEQQWFTMFSIADSEWIIAVIHFAWGPARIGFGWVSDYFAKRQLLHRVDQMICLLFLPIMSWFVITLGDDLPPFITVFCLFVSEFGPAIIHTILETLMVQYYQQTKDQISPTCRRTQLLGKMIGGYTGAWILHHSNVNVVFFVQFIWFVLLLGFLGWKIRPILKQPYEHVSDGRIPREEEQPDMNGKADNLSLVGYVAFMIAISCFPIGKNAYFYYLLGPLQFTPHQFGFAKGLITLVSLLGTYTYGVIKSYSIGSITSFTAYLFVVSSGLKIVQVWLTGGTAAGSACAVNM